MKTSIFVLIILFVCNMAICGDATTKPELLPPLSVKTEEMVVDLGRVVVRPLPSGTIQTLVPLRKENQTRVHVFRDHKLKTVLAYPFTLEFVGTPADLSRLLFTEPGTDPLTGKPDVSYRIIKGDKPGQSRLMRGLTDGEIRWFAPSIPDSRLLTWTILEPGKGIKEIGITGSDDKDHDVTLRFGENSPHCECYLVNDRTGELTLAFVDGTLSQEKPAARETRWTLKPDQIGHKIMAIYRLGNDNILCEHGNGMTQVNVLTGTITNRFDLKAIRNRAGTGELCLSPELINMTGQIILEEPNATLVIYHRLDQGKLVRLGQHSQLVGSEVRYIPVIDQAGRFHVFSVYRKAGQLFVEEQRPE